MIENKKVITWSLIVLFLCLSIVYSLTYQKKQYLFKSPANNITSQTGTQSGGFDVENNESLIKENGIVNPSNSISLGDISQPSGVTNSNINSNSSSDSVHLPSNYVKVLPGTTEYFGTLDIINILGKKPELTLQDSRGNYFAYYGDHLDFISTVQTLGGNVYEMVTESEILQNELFGDRVSYINLSMFKNTWVIMVIEVDGAVWLLQIPADKYHYSKDYLKSLFIQ